VDRQTFFEHLRQSRLVPEDRLAALAARFGADVPAQDIAGKLVEEGVLTRFQAQQIWAGKGRGLVLGQYHVLDKLGEGGFGQVYKALHTLMDRQVAVKVIAPELVQDTRARQWFLREVLATTQLSHPNIVMAYDANEVDDVLFLVMEYVDGPNLDAYVKAQGPLPVAVACEMMRQAAQALGHAHEKGMVHRDIKPANLLIAEGAGPGRAGPFLVKVVDFGLARLQQTAKAGTLMLQNDKAFVGTPDYVSPEQARNMHAVDIRSDLYSLGCTCYYALTARRPFQGTTLLEVVVQHLEQDPEPLEECRTDVPEPVRAIVRRLMAKKLSENRHNPLNFSGFRGAECRSRIVSKEPGDRFQTPAELVEALARWCLSEAPRAATPVPAAAAAPGSGESSARLGAPPSSSATALLPQLAFWDGPALSRDGSVALAVNPDSTPPTGGDGTPVPGPPVEPRSELSDAELSAAEFVLRLDEPEEEAPSPAAQDEVVPADAPPAPPFRAGEDLRRCWGQWLAVVEAFARGGQVRVSEKGYRALHGRLLEHCRAPGGGGARPAVLECLESVVEPWLTPRTLATTDRETLASLLLQCAEMDRELCGRERRSLWPVAALAAVLAVALALGWYASRLHGWPAAVDPVTDWVCALVGARPVLFLAATVPAVLLGVLFGLSRLLRT
jgi:serine/threonine protein kinase